MNATTQPRGGSVQQDAAMRFAVDKPLSTGELWSIARKQIFSWLMLAAIIFLGWFVTMAVVFGETYLDASSLGVLTMGAICVGLTPFNMGWDKEKLRALSLSTREIRTVKVMIVVPLVVAMEVGAWAFALTSIGAGNFNFGYFLVIVVALHCAALYDAVGRTTPERTEVVAAALDGSERGDKNAGQAGAANLVEEFIAAPARKAYKGIALAAGLPLVIIMAAWIAFDAWGPRILATAAAIFIAIMTVTVGGVLEQQFTKWLSFGARRDVWFRQVAKRLVVGAAVTVLVGYVFTGVLMILGERLGRDLGFALNVTEAEFALLWLMTAMAMTGVAIFAVAMSTRLSNQGDGWVGFFSFIVLLCVGMLISTATNAWTVMMLSGRDIWGESLAMVAGVHGAVGLLLAVLGVLVLKRASVMMDLAYVGSGQIFGIKAN